MVGSLFCCESDFPGDGDVLGVGNGDCSGVATAIIPEESLCGWAGDGGEIGVRERGEGGGVDCI